MRRVYASALLLTSLACGPKRVATPEAAPPPAPARSSTVAAAPETPRPPGLRLPRSVQPVRYALTLRVDPDAPGFQGQVSIELAVAEPSAFLWLNAAELEVTAASVEAGGPSRPARVVSAPPDFVGFAFDPPLPRGTARLSLEYHGAYKDTDDRGVFREKSGGDNYIFTQFESFDARDAVPCFDEPSFKVPWQLTLEVPPAMVAVANTPITGEEMKDGMRRIRFAESKPIPAYLLAFGVGPFEIVDAGRAGKAQVPLRIFVPKGGSDATGIAKEISAEALNRLERWFDIPYPYEKLDLLVIPYLVSFGAMENAGLITVRREYLLAKKEQETPELRRRMASLLVHEMAHQWFGDLVTMEWWDDIWLNEAFASWMEGKILSAWHPEWHWEVIDVEEASFAMRGDALATARSIRQPIKDQGDIHNAFDAITYQKGSTVIGMFERFMGEERFRQGVKRYLERHAWGNATHRELLDALDAAAERPVSQAFLSFLDQPGVPLISGKLTCPAGQGPQLALSQSRFIPLGSGAPPASWRIPVCVRFGGAESGRTCALLEGPEATLALPSKSCPKWLLLNDAAGGYYHAAYTPQALAAVLAEKQAVGLAEKVAVLRDMRASVRGGALALGDMLALLPALAKDETPQITGALLDAATMPRPAMVPPELEPAYGRFLSKTFGARARALGFVPRPKEDEELRLLRGELVQTVADRGADPALRAQARKLADAWLAGKQELAEDSARLALSVAAQHGDRPFFDRLAAAAKKESDGRRRTVMVEALADFLDPALVNASLQLFLEGSFDPRESVELLLQDPRSAPLVFAMMQNSYGMMLKRLPHELVGFLPRVGASFCTAEQQAALKAFFAPRMTELPGSARTLAQSLEEIQLCIAFKQHNAEGLKRFLSK